jgi:signal transduction histidine kinase
VLVAIAKIQRNLMDAESLRQSELILIALGDKVGNLVHRLNNSIGTTKYWVREVKNEIAKGNLDPAFLSEAIGEIAGGVEDAALIPTEMRAMFVESKVGSVREILDAIVQRYCSSADLEVEVLVDKSIPPVQAVGLERVFENLIRNAVEAMEGKGRIDVRVVPFSVGTNRYIEATIDDSGPGIPPDLLHKIFEMNVTTKEDREGSGLGFGLWWTRVYVKRNGGEIWAENRDGTGARFVIRLPIPTEDQFKEN